MKTKITILIMFSFISCFAQMEDKKEICFVKSDQDFGEKATFQVKLADLDKDGDLDAVTANMHLNYGQVLLNDGKGNFTDSGQKLTQKGHGVALGDIDMDGDDDIVMTCANNDRKTKIYLNDGKANFTDSGQDMDDFEFSGNCTDLIDIDCDNDLDYVVDYYKQPFGIYLNNGNGEFKKSEQSFPEGNAIIYGFLNNDSFIDVFMKIPGKGYQVLLNNGKGEFKTGWEYSDTIATHGYYSVAFDDFDQDGDNDAFICNGDNSSSSESKYFKNDGFGNFTDTGLRFSKTKWAWTNTGDLNNDGFIDIFISNFLQPNEIWLNDGKGSFYDSGLRLSGEASTRGFSLGDIDNDGDLDAFIANFLKGSNEIWFNCLNDK